MSDCCPLGYLFLDAMETSSISFQQFMFTNHDRNLVTDGKRTHKNTSRHTLIIMNVALVVIYYHFHSLSDFVGIQLLYLLCFGHFVGPPLEITWPPASCLLALRIRLVAVIGVPFAYDIYNSSIVPFSSAYDKQHSKFNTSLANLKCLPFACFCFYLTY